MRIMVIRFGLGSDSTLGMIYLDGVMAGYTLEDERRLVKVKGETCIPEGSYLVKLRTEGPTHEKYRQLYPDIHRGMLWLQDVPEFEFILIHQGNTDQDTAGCILVGGRPALKLGDAKCEFEVGESAVAYRRIYLAVLAAMDRGEEIMLHVRTKAALAA